MTGIKKTGFALAAFFATLPAFAEEAATTTAATVNGLTGIGSSIGYAALGVGIMMGVAVLGGTMGQGRAAAAALDGIARNPGAQNKIFVQLLLALALMESLVLFSLIIGLQMSGAVINVLKLIK